MVKNIVKGRKGLGRIHKADRRDRKFLIQSLLPKKKSTRTSRYWRADYWNGDQGEHPYCVGYGFTHWLQADPVTHGRKLPPVDPVKLYKAAQALDGDPTPHDGTTVRAGAEALRKMGFIKSYNWAWDINTMIQAVLELGPVTVGTNWYNNMFTPDKNGLIKTTGALAGGHCWLVVGVDTIKKQFKLLNSWGARWGLGGYAYISFTDMAKLIRLQGEVCLAVELPKVATARKAKKAKKAKKSKARR